MVKYFFSRQVAVYFVLQYQIRGQGNWKGAFCVTWDNKALQHKLWGGGAPKSFAEERKLWRWHCASTALHTWAGLRYLPGCECHLKCHLLLKCGLKVNPGPSRGIPMSLTAPFGALQAPNPFDISIKNALCVHHHLHPLPVQLMAENLRTWVNLREYRHCHGGEQIFPFHKILSFLPRNNLDFCKMIHKLWCTFLNQVL